MNLKIYVSLFGIVIVSFAGLGQGQEVGFSVDLDVPLYQQEDHNLPTEEQTLCGAASLQMMMMGYPEPADRACFKQQAIENQLQSQAPATDDWLWSTPEEMQSAIHTLNHPTPPGSYEIFEGEKVDRSTIMFNALYWMTRRRYPTATLVNGGYHWVVIRGFETNLDPTTTEQVELYNLLINDPAPEDCDGPWDEPCTPVVEGSGGGCVRHVDGESWYDNEWDDGVMFGDSRYKFFALVEPPAVDGRVAEGTRRICGDPISPDDVINIAKRHIVERKLYEDDNFRFLVESEAAGPLHVESRTHAYFIVPFRNKNTGQIPGAMLLHALTGEFQEIAACKCRLRYLTETEAITHVMRAIDADPTTQFKAQLVFDWCRETSSRYQPLWEVEVFDGDSHRVLFVDQCGRVHPKLTYMP